MEHKQKQIWIELLQCGGIPEIAAQKFNHKLEDYQVAKSNPDFSEWAKEFAKSFTDYFEGFLIGRVFHLAKELDRMDAREHPNYARVHAEFVKLLDRTAPLFEKMKAFGKQGSGYPPTDVEIELVNEAPV
jgi:hypothetical protein